MKYCRIIFYTLIFIIGFIFFLISEKKNLFEPFINNNCPNILIKKNNSIYLYNSNLAQIPGRNPIIFKNLNEYTEYMKWERNQGIRCPILFLEKNYDTQGNVIYKQNYLKNINIDNNNNNNSNNNNNKGMDSLLVDANRNNPPYNKNLYPGYDKQNQYVGLKTPLDNI